MLSSLEEDLKKVFLAGVGAVALTAEKAEALVGELVKKGQITVEQGKVLNEELARKIKTAVKDVRADFCDEPKPAAVDVEQMTPEERAALRRKLDELDGKSCE